MKNISLVLLLTLMGGCSTFNSQKGDEFNLKQQESTTLPGSDIQLRFERVVSDSRCMPGMQCFWEGVAEVELSLWSNRQSQRVSLFSTDTGTTFHKSVVVQGYRISFQKLMPEFEANTTPIALLTLRVELVE
ncbi:MAG: hypothetical protein JNN12_01590 [Bacteroidetes Order II. Incertae sedis bacterium]|nr:hypothetical protein [Bacteroidetes Order II. bacterium]